MKYNRCNADDDDRYKNALELKNQGNEKEAFELLLQLAEKGHTEAQNKLGDCYNERKGVSQDFTEAVKWYRKAAEQGNSDAQTNLGGMYRKGYGVKKDSAESIKWYQKAAEQGDKGAKKSLKKFYDK